MTGLTPLGGTTRLAASSTLKWPGGMSGSGTCLMVTTIFMGPPESIRPVFSVERFGHDLGQVADLESLLHVESAHAVFEHRHAERAGHGHAARRRLERLIQAVVTDARAPLLLHERARPASAAAETSVSAAW